MKLLHRVLAVLLFQGCIATGAPAQDYPTRPIRMLVGVVPGGATDILARVIGQKMSENWGQQVIVDNRPGANQIIAASLTVSAAPDGYTLQMIPASPTSSPTRAPGPGNCRTALRASAPPATCAGSCSPSSPR
jgi:tripartite-type tricarboxylate transporter receptor subunit TctC